MDGTYGGIITQSAFNSIARAVNKDFVQLGYPTILTKKGNRDFVSLFALMQNCSTLLMNSSSTKCRSQSKKRSSLFSSSKSSSRQSKQQQQQQQQLLLLQSFESKIASDVAQAMGFDDSAAAGDFASVHEGISETVRRDCEQIISACLPELQEMQEQQQQDQPSTNSTSLLFFATRWVQFKDAVIRGLLEAANLRAELNSLLRSSVGCKSRSLSRPRATTGQESLPPAVSATKIPSLEAEIRRLKLDLDRQAQRRKVEQQRHAKERDRLARELQRQAQRKGQQQQSLLRRPGVPCLGSGGLHQQQQSTAGCIIEAKDSLASSAAAAAAGGQQRSCSGRQVLGDARQAVDRLAEAIGYVPFLLQLQLPPPPAQGATDQQQQQQLAVVGQGRNEEQAYVSSVCTAAQSCILGLQADCHDTRKRLADLEVLISILKARLDLSNDQLVDAVKFEKVVSDIAKRLSGAGAGGPPAVPAAAAAASGTGDDVRDSLVSRLTSRLRERHNRGTTA